MEHAPLEWTKIMQCPPWRGPPLWNTFPRVDQGYGMSSLEWTKMMEYPHGGPQDDVITII